MTALEAMTRHAIAEFDRMVDAQEAEIRAGLAAYGKSEAEIEMHIAACLPNLAAQRLQIGELVAAELAKAGVPLDMRIKQ